MILWHYLCSMPRARMDASTTVAKPAPLKIVNFLAELVRETPCPGKIVAVEVEAGTYRVTLALPERGLVAVPLSAFDVSRSVRGDREALATLGANLVRGASREL
jgi:hypothetical protein